MHRTGIVLRSSIAAAGIFSPDNLQERLIGRLSGAKNDTVAQQSAAACLQRFGEHGHIEKKTGMFVKYHSGRDCTVKETKDTPSDFAARVIEANCYLLYWPGEGNRKTAMVIDQALLARVRLEPVEVGLADLISNVMLAADANLRGEAPQYLHDELCWPPIVPVSVPGNAGSSGHLTNRKTSYGACGNHTRRLGTRRCGATR